MEEQREKYLEGMTEDGYIKDQDFFSDFEYRTMPSSYNGCGWMAAYNLRHYLRQKVSFDEVRKEMNSLYTLPIPGPTTMRVMREYLKKYIPEIRESLGRERAEDAMKSSVAGILRYNESGVPHFISFYRIENNVFRFFNVEDGLEDCLYEPERFFTERCLPGYTAAFTVEETKE